MTTNAEIFCRHVDDDWLAGSDCWLCPGCLCAVCSRCRQLYTSFPALGDEEAPWWTHSCQCRSEYSLDVLTPPKCWIRDAVTVDPHSPPRIPQQDLVRAAPPDAGATIAKLKGRLTASDGSGHVDLRTMHVALDEAQKVALYWAALGQGKVFSSFVTLVDSLTKDIGDVEPRLIENDLKYAVTVRKVRDAEDIIDYSGGDPSMKNKLSLRLFLQGMTEDEILAQARQDPDFRERIAPLHPAIAARAASPEMPPKTKAGWWKRIRGKVE